MSQLQAARARIRELKIADEQTVLSTLIAQADLSAAQKTGFQADAVELIEAIRADDEPGLMEVFLTEYGLSTEEGVALMCLAEALLRVPDAETIDELIEDKIAPSSWGEHLGKSSSSLVNASTWALMLTGKVLSDDQSSGVSGLLHSAVKRLGEPVIRTAVKAAMKEMGNQFVLGETIEAAIERGSQMEEKGYTYSYDMLGEAALTMRDATDYFNAYHHSLTSLGKYARHNDVRDNPGISVKLSALHPRYEVGQYDRVIKELVPQLTDLALLAKSANMGLNIDAEEADRLDLSLDIIQHVLADERMQGWDGFGVVVQAYGKRAAPVLDWLYALAESLDRKIMVRLVKGAYWDSEIKRAQVEGLEDFPVYTRKSATDVSYICCATKLLGMTDRIYPQFATHNAHTIGAILQLSNNTNSYEFQRLHGMGEVLHRLVKDRNNTRCRIYAPVGAHRDLLAYLVRRLLENGANSSFVNQVVDTTIPADDIAKDPFVQLDHDYQQRTPHIVLPGNLFAPRNNSKGFDLRDEETVLQIDSARAAYRDAQWKSVPIIDNSHATDNQPSRDADTQSPDDVLQITNPFDSNDTVGTVRQANDDDIERALTSATPWDGTDTTTRAHILNKAADLYEENYAEIFAVLCREAGKTTVDAVAELREAVDFLRYYADGAVATEHAIETNKTADQLAQHQQHPPHSARGLIVCISPWNFPLAIFTGQIAAALAAGNAVIAKPADPTPLVAHLAVSLMHRAGVPRATLQLLPGTGAQVGAKLVADKRIDGVCFTGSTATAQRINQSMADNVSPDAPLVAETGGLNAMIVDSTALPEQAVGDIVASAFQSAGQRCSACRLLYLQEDIADDFLQMLFGAMDELVVGDPWDFTTDSGPVITEEARRSIMEHVEQAKSEGRLLKQLNTPATGTFVGPAIISVKGIADLKREIFGPVLHVATFAAEEIDQIVADINHSGYGLTFGLHTRIDDRVEQITRQLNVGNIYINRNQIGAVVGSQPFGGEGLSGTGPKAGGPHYIKRFVQLNEAVNTETTHTGNALQTNDSSHNTQIDATALQQAIDSIPPAERHTINAVNLPGPTGESNRLREFAKGLVLCLGPTVKDATAQAKVAQSVGCPTLIVCPQPSAQDQESSVVKTQTTENHESVAPAVIDGTLTIDALSNASGFVAVAYRGDTATARQIRQALANRSGPLLPLFTERDFADWCIVERHTCIDTTASGGNASLLAYGE
jgi:RHH-type proline utilization regulon transcriptional repressor/proline dehydrogenase/delta 1-pyrroline-5-carboxylate dehydrogenase